MKLPSAHTLGREGLNIGLIALGVLSAAMGIEGFLLPSRFIDGGVTGISMLLSSTLGWPLALTIPALNLPFLVLGYRTLGLPFALRSSVTIAALALCLVVGRFPDVTADSLLSAIFGGALIGAGIGLTMRGGAVLDGTEVAALLISRSTSVLRVNDAVLLLNVVIFGAAIFLLGVEEALYSILTYFAAARMLDFILYGIEEYNAITIISREAPAIRRAITEELGRSVTVYKGEGGASSTPQDILYCVVTRLEVSRIKRSAQRLDPDAFIITHALADVDGGLLKRRTML